jgi:hypothetical protein
MVCLPTVPCVHGNICQLLSAEDCLLKSPSLSPWECHQHHWTSVSCLLSVTLWTSVSLSPLVASATSRV